MAPLDVLLVLIFLDVPSIYDLGLSMAMTDVKSKAIFMFIGYFLMTLKLFQDVDIISLIFTETEEQR